jgi:hypothetical protein
MSKKEIIVRELESVPEEEFEALLHFISSLESTDFQPISMPSTWPANCRSAGRAIRPPCGRPPRA